MIKQTNCNAKVEGKLLKLLIYQHDSVGLKNSHKINYLDQFLPFLKYYLDITFPVPFRFPFRVLATPLERHPEGKEYQIKKLEL